MNRSLLGRIASFLFAFYALSLLAFFSYALLTFSATQFLPSMRWEFALKRGFVLFMDYLIPVHAAAVAVGASLAGVTQARRAPGAAPEPFNKLVSSTLVTFLVLTAGYTVLYEGLYPGARRGLSDMQYRSSLARQYMGQADAEVKKGDFRAGLDAVDRYLAIDPSNKEAANQRLELVARAVRQSPPVPGPKVAGLAATSPDTSAQALVEKARFYYEREDWFSAHYYAQAASVLDPRRADAIRLAAQASEKLDLVLEAEKDAKNAELFRQKKAAYTMLLGGNVVPAYYRFLQLQKENPGDSDIARYLAVASEKVAQTTFFLDDARKMETLPGTQNILFLNVKEKDATEAVYIGKMVEQSLGDAYFFDIEAVRYDAAGAVMWHFGAPYGRREGDSILMNCVDRTDSRLRFLPRYAQGTRAPAEMNVLALPPTVEQLRSLSLGRDALAVLGLAELWRMRADLASFGLSREALSVDMAMKMLMPCVFLILSIFALSLGWAFRARYFGRLSIFAVILMPLVPLVLSVLSLLYVHAHRVIIGFTVLAFGFSAALAVLAALQVILLAVALIMLAGQSTR
jgi:tetratricopeptide (TPR) repeat protein